MAGAFTNVNLSQIPSPNVVELIDYATILAEMKARLIELDPSFTALVESDPAYKVLEVAAYRETLVRQRANDACRAVMLAFSVGSDLDQIGANYDVGRFVLDAGDPLAVPPIPPTYESDDDFRARIQLSFEGYTTAGSEGSYVFHALSADPDVKDASAVSPTPGVIIVYVLARSGDGTASDDLLDTVNAALNAEFVRPLTDNVTVESAEIIEYEITAELTLYPGPDSSVVLASAIAAAQAYADSVRKIGFDVARSGCDRALHQPGVQNVTLTQPATNVVTADGQAAHCTLITITVATDTDV